MRAATPRVKAPAKTPALRKLQKKTLRLQTRCAFYARSATNGTSENTTGKQIAALRWHFRKFKKWTVVGEYQDLAASGSSLKHEQLQRLIGEASTGAFDVVAITSLDRISRDAMLAQAFLQKMASFSVSVYSMEEGTYLCWWPPRCYF